MCALPMATCVQLHVAIFSTSFHRKPINRRPVEKHGENNTVANKASNQRYDPKNRWDDSIPHRGSLVRTLASVRARIESAPKAENTRVPGKKEVPGALSGLEG